MTISIVLYGRNDNYGYNLHKRAALSLNCMAEVLTDSSDEILFVDYNTPDDFPTFPEAIQDTLTERARARLRILRVRPYIHQRFRPKTHLVALEPIARNVAIRRSSPTNRWILSTNTDMIFVPRGGRSLSQIAQHLPPGFYHAPRIEIPEVLWESLDRHAPAEIIATVREWGSSLHLNEIVLGSKFILYDGPGDFQLLLRQDLFDNHGFHEEMLLGWHVDSNIAKRMYLKYDKVGDLGGEVYGYHCDHTRQVTPAHSHTRLQNDWRRFCDEVDSPDISEQADAWGCVNDTIEEVRLIENPARIYVQALCDAIGTPLTEPQITKYTHETYDRSNYDPRHMVPFLADMFASMPRSTNVVWYGAGVDMLSRFAAAWKRLGFSGKILADPDLVSRDDVPEPVKFFPQSDRQNIADAFVFDFGDLPGSPQEDERKKPVIHKLLRRFMNVVGEERRRMSAGSPGRRVIALNAINNQFEQLVHGYVAAAATPCATHMRHGFVLPDKPKHDWLPLLQIGRAGVRVDGHLESDSRNVGIIAYGPYRYLEAGQYCLSVKIQKTFAEDGGDDPCIYMVVNSGAQVFGTYLIRRSALAKADHDFLFTVPPTAAELIGGIETRIMLLAHVALSIEAVIVESIPATSPRMDIASTLLSPVALQIEDWLPYLSLGPLGRADDSWVTSPSGPADFVVFGPYWPLLAGHYELIIDLEYHGNAPRLKHMVLKADVMTGDQQLVAAEFRLDPLCVATKIRLPFEMVGTSSEWRQVETRLWSSGEEVFRVTSLSVKALTQSAERDLFPYLLLGDAGRRIAVGIGEIGGRNGVVAYSPKMRFAPGSYRVSFTIEEGNTDETYEGSQGSSFALIKYGAELLGVKEIKKTANKLEKHSITFTVPSTSDQKAGLEFFLQVIGRSSICLRTLVVEPVGIAPEHQSPVVLTVRDWLPFLRNGKSAHALENGIVVGEGVQEFALYGPFWLLPAGRYEMRAMVVPNPLSRDCSTFATVQVAGAEGTRVFAESKWLLGHYKLSNPTASVEFRLPFTLSEDLPTAARTIETRILTPGDVTFHILSLTVVAKEENFEGDWFPYLTVQRSGTHSGVEITNAHGEFGYMASTAPLPLLSGQYRLEPAISKRSPQGAELSFELWSGADLFAIASADGKDELPLEFEVPNEFYGKPVELRIRSFTPTNLAICAIKVEKLSDKADPGWRERLARTQSQMRIKRMRNQLAHGDVRSVAGQIFRAAIAKFSKRFGASGHRPLSH